MAGLRWGAALSCCLALSTFGHAAGEFLNAGNRAAPPDVVEAQDSCTMPSDSLTLISAARSMVDQQVNIKAVVTATVPNLNGYYLQDPDGGDNDPSTSDGIWALNHVSYDVIITELADPDNADAARFVELHSVGGQDLTGLILQRWTNSEPDPSSNVIDLSSHVLAAGEFLIVCYNKAVFDLMYAPITCDIEGGRDSPADSNGDDQIAVVQNTDKTIIDIFGDPGQDGTGTGHDFENGRAERQENVREARANWNFLDWNIDNENAGRGKQNAPEGYDPRSWIGNTASRGAGAARALASLQTVTPVQYGQLIEFSGIVRNNFGNIYLVPCVVPSCVKVCGQATVPQPVELSQLPTRGDVQNGFWNPYYGMVVKLTAPALISNIYELARFGEVTLATGARPVVASQIYDPMSADHDQHIANLRDTLVLADGGSSSPIPFPGEGFSADNILRGGDDMLDVTGPLHFRFRKTILDISPDLPQPVHNPTNPRTAEAPIVGGRIQIASVNVENYFNGPPLGLAFGDPAGRGAKSATQFERQRVKICTNMYMLDASVYALAEVENNGNGQGSAVQDLVLGLNELAGDHTNTLFATIDIAGKVGTDVISSNFIYKTTAVRVVGDIAILNSSVDADFIDDKSRPSIAVTFEELEGSERERVTVVANHFKSKGSSCEDCCDDPPIDGVGNCNGVRTNASWALGRWLLTNPTGIETPNVMITGDMNSYHAESPIQVLIQDFGFVDMIDQFKSKEEAYSFSFSGFVGYLDHVLASQSLSGKVTTVADWHTNSDESVVFEYDQCDLWRPDVYRASDHDPVLVGLFEVAAPTTPTPSNVTLISEVRKMEGGQDVVVRGVVTAVVPNAQGYYIQEAFGGDNDPSTSDGILVWVATNTITVVEGDYLELDATITQSSSFGPQLTSVKQSVKLGTEKVPAPVSLLKLPARYEVASGFWEPFFGMVVKVDVPVMVTDMYELSGSSFRAGYGEITVSTGVRPIVPSQIHAPLSAAHNRTADSYRDTLILSAGGLQDPVPFPDDGFTERNYVRTGDMMMNVVGPLSNRFGKNILDKAPGLTQPLHVRSNPRTGPPRVGGRLQVASVNVENYFAGPPGLPFGDPRGRGAETPEQFAKQRAKVISSMAALDATIYAIAEVENTDTGSAIQDLVTGLNAAVGDTSNTLYAVISMDGKVGTDVITSSVVYKTTVVKVIGNIGVLDSSVDPEFLDDKSRPSIAVTFEELDGANQVTVVANHLKSKGSSCAACCDDPELPGAGNCNGVRTRAAAALGRWMQTYPTGIQTTNVLLTGDFNSYHAESPIQTLIQDFGYADLIDMFKGKEVSYSYVYAGEAGYLDHAIASASLAQHVTQVADWHTNADEASLLGYANSRDCNYWRPYEFRASDHDPMLVGLFTEAAPTPAPTPPAPAPTPAPAPGGSSWFISISLSLLALLLIGGVFSCIRYRREQLDNPMQMEMSIWDRTRSHFSVAGVSNVGAAGVSNAGALGSGSTVEPPLPESVAVRAQRSNLSQEPGNPLI